MCTGLAAEGQGQAQQAKACCSSSGVRAERGWCLEGVRQQTQVHLQMAKRPVTRSKHEGGPFVPVETLALYRLLYRYGEYSVVCVTGLASQHVQTRL